MLRVAAITPAPAVCPVRRGVEHNRSRRLRRERYERQQQARGERRVNARVNADTLRMPWAFVHYSPQADALRHAVRVAFEALAGRAGRAVVTAAKLLQGQGEQIVSPRVPPVVPISAQPQSGAQPFRRCIAG